MTKSLMDCVQQATSQTFALQSCVVIMLVNLLVTLRSSTFRWRRVSPSRCVQRLPSAAASDDTTHLCSTCKFRRRLTDALHCSDVFQGLHCHHRLIEGQLTSFVHIHTFWLSWRGSSQELLRLGPALGLLFRISS